MTHGRKDHVSVYTQAAKARASADVAGTKHNPVNLLSSSHRHSYKSRGTHCIATDECRLVACLGEHLCTQGIVAAMGGHMLWSSCHCCCIDRSRNEDLCFCMTGDLADLPLHITVTACGMLGHRLNARASLGGARSL